MDKTQYEQDPHAYWEIPGLIGFDWRYTGLPDRKEHPLFDEAILPEIKENKNHDLCVDLGCGAGRYIGYAAEYFKQVIGVDFSRHSLDQSKQLTDSAHIQNVDYYLAGVQSMPEIKDNSVDFAFTGVVFTHMPNEIRQAGLKEVARILKPEGCVVLIEVFLEHNESFDCPSVSPEQWEGMIKEAGLKLVKQEAVWSLTKYKLMRI